MLRGTMNITYFSSLYRIEGGGADRKCNTKESTKYNFTITIITIIPPHSIEILDLRLRNINLKKLFKNGFNRFK